jgi:predicted homoserine dehydrogenase-like protein
MNLHRLLQQRAATGEPARVGLIGVTVPPGWLED